MARIRTIKPEFWTSEQVMECSPNARLLFIGLWNFCDDVGRMPASPKQIKALVFPSDDFTSENVRGMIDELEANGLLRRYVVEGKEFIAVTGWHHQKIDKPQKAKTPEPPDDEPPPIRRTFGVGREGNTEGKGRDSKTGGGSDSHPARPTLNEATDEPTSIAEPPRPPAPPPWNSRENFDRVERRCREVLPRDWAHDLVVSPMARLEGEQGLDLEREIVPALLDLVATRRIPLRTWRVLADAVAERVAVQRQARTAEGLSPTPPAAEEVEWVPLQGLNPIPANLLVRLLDEWRKGGPWPVMMLGDRLPGKPGCPIPARFLVGEAA